MLFLYIDDLVLIGPDEPEGTISADAFARHMRCKR